MRGSRSHKLLLLLGALVPLLALPSRGQENKDDKVLLISAKSAQLIEENGENYRKVVGPAKFFHNNTYLLCDTALWNVGTNIIDAVGHVRIIQDQTTLTSATLQYVVDENMARFRGNLVELEDKDKNTLRTRYLDYNTRDSVAIFQDGGAMRDKDGQVIESRYGTYDSKAHLFVFNDQVNMYMDTTFIKTSRLEYRSDLSTAYFGFGTDMWQDDKMLSANDGWYNRKEELFFFRRKVHLLTQDREIWADSLYYHRDLGDVDMLGNVEMMDTTRNMYALAGRFEYTDSLNRVKMSRDPAVMSIEEKDNQRDTLYLGADTLVYRGIPRCDVPEAWVADAKKRLSDISGDPVMEYRKKAAEAAAEAAAKAAEEAAKNDPNNPLNRKKNGVNGAEKPADTGKQAAPEKPVAPEKPAAADTLGTPDQVGGDAPVMPGPDQASREEAPADSLATSADTLAAPEPPKDTTKVGFVWGTKAVRLFRRNLQMAADSLHYSDLDSLARLYKDPIFFSDGNRQYASDSIYMVIKERRLQKAHLLSNAFITIEEAPRSYDQVRGTEMVAYFDSTTALTRFDALGGASSLFFLEENGALATVNKVDTKMLYATFKDGELERMYYYDNPKNDGYPSVQLPDEERELKGFRWEPDRRPKSPRDVTELEPRASQRLAYLARPHTTFEQTEVYYPGYIKKVYRDIAIRDSLEVVRKRQAQFRADSLALAAQFQADSLALADSLAVLAKTDSLAHVGTDSLSVMPDSVSVMSDPDRASRDSLTVAPQPSPAELKAAEKEAAKRAEQARKAAQKEKQEQEKARRKSLQEAKWAQKDSVYLAKKEAKALKKLEKERARKLKLLRRLEKRAQKERRQYEKYLLKEQEKLLSRKNRKKDKE